MKTKVETQFARTLAMRRLSHSIAEQYDPRQHRRAVRITRSWMADQPGTRVRGPSVLSKVVLDSYHFSHRGIARVLRRAAASA